MAHKINHGEKSYFKRSRSRILANQIVENEDEDQC